MKTKQKLAGGLIAVGVIIGAILMGLFSGFGLGGGKGGKSETKATGAASPDASRPLDRNAEIISTRPPADRDQAGPREPSGLTTVVPGGLSLANPELTGRENDDSAESPARLMPGGVLSVLIDDRRFFIRTDDDGAIEDRPVELPEVIRLAKLARGNEDGIRVRISRKGSARATAEIRLRDALTDAEITGDAVRWLDELAP